MKQLIYTEWLKVKNYRTFWIMLLLAVGVIAAGNYVVVNVVIGQLGKASQMVGQGPVSFPYVWQTVANVSSYISSLFGLLLVILVTNEYTFRTHRQNIIDGWERKQFVYAKLFWVVALSVLALVVVTIIAAIVGLMYGNSSFTTDGFVYLFYYFLQVLLTLCLALLLSVLVKRAGFAIVLFLGYTMMLEQTMVFILKKNWGRIGGLMPLQTGDELLPFPVIGNLISMGDRYDDNVYLMMLLVYIVLVVFFVFRRVLRSDL
ncbi:MAG TPA: ABC transporter permease [Chitinophaga sp.]|uniref:ABC transporter permease n=1 Tax=Chitinophaga sp. TaxID=1869181 RepID=UPI002BA799BE|nr:ABC transporter permease [Chitinophaga sp.]HVI49497.1 ABC transporter permease [Chitinophaga sp.]